MTTGGRRVEHDGGQALGCSIDSRCQSGWSRTDHHHVEPGFRFQPGRQSHRVRKASVGRVAQDLVTPEDQWSVVWGHPEAAYQRFGCPISLQVDEPVREAVANGELPQPLGVAREARPHDPETLASLDEHRSAGQVGTQYDVSELGVVGQKPGQDAHRDGDHLARFHDYRGDEERLAGQQAQLPEKATGSMDPDDLVVLGTSAVDHCHQAAENDIEIAGSIPLAVEALATGDLSAMPFLRQDPHLPLRQPGKGVVVVGRLCQLGKWVRVIDSIDSGRSRPTVGRHDSITRHAIYESQDGWPGPSRSWDHEGFVHVAPEPVFIRLERADDRMARGVEVLRGVAPG